MSRPLGSTLATTIVTLGLALLLGLALSSASLTHLRQASNRVHWVKAEAAAEAAVAEAIERIVSEPEFGIARDPAQTIDIELDEAHGLLSFDPGTCQNLNMAESTSNRFGLEPIAGWDDSIVPPRTVQLLAVGRSSQVEVKLEVMLQVPEFPYVVASSGPIESDGALKVGSVSAPANVTGSEDLRPSALAANGPVDIQGAAQIIGSVISTDTINLGSSVNLVGELKPNSAETTIDDLDVIGLKPELTLPYVPTPAPVLDTRYHHNGPSLGITGGLTLDNGVLFVNGDCVITGGVEGRGAVIVNGSLTVNGASDLAATTQIALVSQGDLTITGDSQDNSFFQGLIYTEGDFYAEDITLIGAFVANQQSSSVNPGSRMQLRNATLASFADYSSFSLDSAIFLVWGDGDPSSLGGTETLYMLEVDEQDLHILEQPGGNASGSGHTSDFDWREILRVLRGRSATVSNGKLVSDWTELDNAGVARVAQATDMMRQKNPGPINELPLLRYQAQPDSLFWQEIRSSLHIDLNEFLNRESRIRVTSWRRI